MSISSITSSLTSIHPILSQQISQSLNETAPGHREDYFSSLPEETQNLNFAILNTLLILQNCETLDDFVAGYLRANDPIDYSPQLQSAIEFAADILS